MNRRSNCAVWMVSGAVIVGAGMAGCQNQDRRADSTRRATTPTTAADLNNRAGRTYGTMSESLMSSSSMAFPTGDEGTSAVLVEKALPREIIVGEQFEYQIRVTNLTDYPLSNVVIHEFTESPASHGAGATGGQVRSAPGTTGRTFATDDPSLYGMEGMKAHDQKGMKTYDQKGVQSQDQKWYRDAAEPDDRPPGPGMLGEEKVPTDAFVEKGAEGDRLRQDQLRRDRLGDDRLDDDRIRGIDDQDFDADADLDVDVHDRDNDGMVDDIDVDADLDRDRFDSPEMREDRLHPLGASPDRQPLDAAGAQRPADGRIIDEQNDDLADFGADPDRLGDDAAVGPYGATRDGRAGMTRQGQPVQQRDLTRENRTFGIEQEQLRALDEPGRSGRAAMGTGQGAEYVIDYLAPGETRTITATAVARDPGLVQFCSTVVYSPVLCSTAMVIAPSLELTRSGPQAASVCEPLTYTLTVTNSGVGSAEGVTITETLPQGVTTADGQREINIDVGTLAAGESRDYTVTVRGQQPGEFNSTARATSARGLTAEASGFTRLIQPQLQVEKIGPEQAYTGVGLDFLVNVRNVGEIAVNNVRVVDQAPPGSQFVRATEGGQFSGNQTTWVIPTLGPGESRTLAVRVEGNQAGTFDNCVRIVSDCGQTVEDCATVTLEGVTGLRLVVLDQDDPIAVGDDEVYTITVKNQGNAEATNVQVAVDVPQEQAFVSAAGPAGRDLQPQQDAGVVTFPSIPVLAPGQEVVFRVITRGQTPGDTRFAARLTADQLTQPVIAQESTHVFDAAPAQPQLNGQRFQGNQPGNQPGQQPGAGVPRGAAPGAPAPTPPGGQQPGQQPGAGQPR